MNGEAAAACATSDFHLVELRGEWRLTIRNTDRLLAVLNDTTSRDGRGEGAQFTVHVEPNLLPGGPFGVAVDVTIDRAVHAIDDGARTTGRDANNSRSTSRPGPRQKE